MDPLSILIQHSTLLLDSYVTELQNLNREHKEKHSYDSDKYLLYEIAPVGFFWSHSGPVPTLLYQLDFCSRESAAPLFVPIAWLISSFRKV